HTRNYVRGLLSAGFVKRSMTRDIDWGIPVPLKQEEAKDKVLYVWFDAPIGYISNTIQWCVEHEQPEANYAQWWKNEDCDIVHFIGEDNTIFHCVIWIAMLKAEGSYRLPRSVVVNQFLNMQFPGQEEEKISKSKGNAIWLWKYLEEGGSVDALRYYLTTIAPERARSAYNPQDLMQKNNADLANTLGNFVNRIVSFTHKYVGAELPQIVDEAVRDIDRDFKADLQKCVDSTTEHLEGYSFKQALEGIMSFARACNRYVDAKEPWVTRKDDMDTTKVTLRYALDAIYSLGVLLLPFIPQSAEKMLAIFAVDVNSITWSDSLKPLTSDIVLQKPEILFQKIEIPEQDS
ncbi:MAG: class I tRNA ligase family protein, partial [Bdellovibrionales bacterium]|nr:class I tRNA ligase family protein [Bdellovibrionales bacterium]